MRKVLTIAATDLKILFQNPGIWLNLIVVPIAIAVAVGFANGAAIGDSAPTAPDVIMDAIDRDGSPESAAFIADLKAVNPNLLVCPLDNTDSDPCGLGSATHDEALANERLETSQSLALLIIPEGFAASLAAGDEMTLIYRSNESAVAPSYIRQALETTVQRWSAAQIAASVGADVFANFSPTANLDREAVRQELVADASAQWAEDPVRVDFVQAAGGQEAQRGEGFSQSVPGIATMYVMFSVLPLINAFILERRNWTFQRLVMMPVSRAQVLGGKLLTYFTLGIIQYAVMFAFGALLGVRYGSDPLALVLLIVAFTACITALALALTPFVRTEAQASGIALFMTMTLAPLGGAWWPLEIVPEWMRTVGHISPVAWVMDGFRSLIFYGGNLGTVVVPLLVLSALAVVFFGIGIVRFQRD